MEISEEKLDRKIREMMAQIMSKCNLFYPDQLVWDFLDPNIDDGSRPYTEYCIFPCENFFDRHFGKTVRNLVVGATLGVVSAARRNIFTVCKWGGEVPGISVGVLDKRIASIVEEEIGNFKLELPDIKVYLHISYFSFVPASHEKSIAT